MLHLRLPLLLLELLLLLQLLLLLLVLLHLYQSRCSSWRLSAALLNQTFLLAAALVGSQLLRAAAAGSSKHLPHRIEVKPNKKSAAHFADQHLLQRSNIYSIRCQLSSSSSSSSGACCWFRR